MPVQDSLQQKWDAGRSIREGRQAVDWTTFDETQYWGHNVEVVCFDGTVTRGPFSCMDNPYDIEEGEPVSIILEYKTYAVEIPVEEIKTITVID